jgi:MFS family permease
MIPWGKAADHFGRKPVLIGSLAGVTAATAVFGLSKKIWQMIVFRCFGGIFAGTIVSVITPNFTDAPCSVAHCKASTIRAMITENSTAKTQARAFSIFAFTGNLGIFLGPILGMWLFFWACLLC